MAVASTAPIQIGRYRSPLCSRSNTSGWLEGISTRTPTTSKGSMRATVTPQAVRQPDQALGNSEGNRAANTAPSSRRANTNSSA